jgi:cell division protein FtsZ
LLYLNVDFADLTTILKDAGYAVIAVGEASLEKNKEERAKIAIETALNSPLLDVDISTADRVLINIIGGEDLTLKEVDLIVSETAKRVSPNAHIIFGARIEKDMKKSAIKVLVVLGGVKFEEEVSEEEVPLDIERL